MGFNKSGYLVFSYLFPPSIHFLPICDLAFFPADNPQAATAALEATSCWWSRWLVGVGVAVEWQRAGVEMLLEI